MARARALMNKSFLLASGLFLGSGETVWVHLSVCPSIPMDVWSPLRLFQAYQSLSQATQRLVWPLKEANSGILKPLKSLHGCLWPFIGYAKHLNG